MFHEYQFVLSFSTYTLGRISVFFVMHGLFAAADAMVSSAIGGTVLMASIPKTVKTFVVLTMFSWTVPLFASIWVEEGMFDLIAALGFRIRFA